MAIYRGVFATIAAAGDRNGICASAAAIREFPRHPVEQPVRNTATVENHVLIADCGHRARAQQVGALLEVARETGQPEDAADDAGLPGASGNRHDRKALTTGILRNAHAGDDRRACIRHGAWGSVRDHEHAHLDPRFVFAASPAGAGVAIGPVEPFCLARRLISAGT